ncbi:hypothetical protein J5X84_38475 [Streptosporangiaceae bacterium NEAU-GS5]|nr:hypothetical protein [Streptosporangiaceae bacterium NEAU-GS5]
MSAGDYALTTSPATLTVTRGGTAFTTVSVTVSGGFTGSVALSLSGLPSGATGSISVTPVVAPGSSHVTVRTTSSTVRGTFSLQITGISGPLTHRVTVPLTVR